MFFETWQIVLLVFPAKLNFSTQNFNAAKIVITISPSLNNRAIARTLESHRTLYMILSLAGVLLANTISAKSFLGLFSSLYLSF